MNALPKITLKDVQYELARRSLEDFQKLFYPEYEIYWHTRNYYKLLDLFIAGKIKKLIVSMPAQHFKSTGSSIMLPCKMLGKNPDLNIAIGSYESIFPQKFNRACQRIIDSETYNSIFPETILDGSKFDNTQHSTVIRTLSEFEIVNKKGGLKVVGRGGALTGNKVDLMIMDDLYKNASEGNSPVIRDQIWDWYNSVVVKRLHNDSQQLIVFTRWNEDDLVGRIEEHDKIIKINSFNDAYYSDDVWFKINFEALKESEKTEIDPREIGDALCPEHHSKEKHEKDRAYDSMLFECMAQGNPTPKEGLLYGEFKTYMRIPEIIKKGNYTDTADQGEDYLCSICYDKDIDNNIYVTDIYYTQEPMEITEPATAAMFERNGTREAKIESNNGGRGFARVIDLNSSTNVSWFHQSKNKESRVRTNAATVMKYIHFPIDWKTRWPEFYHHLSKYKSLYKANKFHDIPDCLTGIVEEEITEVSLTSKIFA